MQPDLSISIVNTNNRSLLRECLASIYRTTERISFQIIVIDNASTDGSAEMVRSEFPSVELIINDARGGYGYSHNKGIAAARGQFVLIFNEDMVVLPGAFDTMVDKLKSDPTIGVLGCRLLNPDLSLQHSCHRFQNIKTEVFENLCPGSLLRGSRFRTEMFGWDHDSEREVDVVMGCCMLIPASILDKVGGFDTRFFVYSEEFDLCKRIRNAGYRVVFTPEAQIIHFGGQTSKTMSIKMHLVYVESKLKYFRKYYGLRSMKAAKLIVGAGALIRLAGWTLRAAGSKDERARNMVKKYASVLSLLASHQ